MNLQQLLEKTRRELLIKQKRESPARVKRSESYSVSNTQIDPEAFLNDWLVISCNISGNSSNYNDVIAFKNVVNDLIEEAKKDSKHIVNSRLIQKSLKNSLDKNDIYIDCDCPDWIYRFEYWSTRDKFKWGKLQTSNGKGIRNPNNNIGSMCKHLYALLRSNTFMNHVSDKIMRVIMANLDILVKRFNINLEEFVVNTARYDRLMAMNLKRDKSGRFISNKNNEKSDEIEGSDND